MKNLKEYLAEFWQQDIVAILFAFLSGLAVEAYFLFRPVATCPAGQPCVEQGRDWASAWLGLAVFFALLAVIVAVAGVKEEVDDLGDELAP